MEVSDQSDDIGRNADSSESKPNSNSGMVLLVGLDAVADANGVVSAEAAAAAAAASRVWATTYAARKWETVSVSMS